MLEPAAPRHIGNYEIISHLKAGGMATLYLARRTGAAGFARHVAIKVVHPHLARQNASFVQMFLDEALLCARIHHPNVVHVEELGEHEGAYFLVMEYVHGAALSQFMKALAERKRRLTPELAVSIAIQIADGLHAAHELRGEDGQSLGVVHRDVSPHNVLLSYAGHVKVIDFGIAKARSHVNETQTKSLKGKLRYMAPEQAFGRPVDRRTDVYALGIVLWELLTLRRLFDAHDDFALLDQVRDPVPIPPSQFSDGIPPALDAAVLRALSPNPDDRPASMQDFRRLLAEAVPGATALDAAHIADLLNAVMTEEIAAQRKMVPDTLSALRSIDDAVARVSEPPVAALSGAERQQILSALTTQADNASMTDDDDDAPASSDSRAGSDSRSGVARPNEPIGRPTTRPRSSAATRTEQLPMPGSTPSATRAADPTVSVRGAKPSSARPVDAQSGSASERAQSLDAPAASGERRASAARPVPAPLLVDELDDAPPKSRAGLIALVLLVLVVGAGGAVAFLRPDLVERLRGGPDEAALAAARLAEQQREHQAALAAQAAIERYGELLVKCPVEGAQVLLFVGRGPVTVRELPPGVAHEFLVIPDDHMAVRGVVAADAEWDDVDGQLRYELPITASESAVAFAELDLGASLLPEVVGVPSAARGEVRVVTNPAGSKVYQLVGFTPEVRVPHVRADEIAELIVFAPGYRAARVVVGPSDWREHGGERTAQVEVALAARPSRRRREHGSDENERDGAGGEGSATEGSAGDGTAPANDTTGAPAAAPAPASAAAPVPAPAPPPPAAAPPTAAP